MKHRVILASLTALAVAASIAACSGARTTSAAAESATGAAGGAGSRLASAQLSPAAAPIAIAGVARPPAPAYEKPKPSLGSTAPAGATFILPAVAAKPRPAPCAKPSTDWNEVRTSPYPLVQGFTGVDSAVPGTDVALYVSSKVSRYRVQAYRMGYYGHADACLVWTSAAQPGRIQPAPRVTGATHTPTAPWSKSLTVSTRDWTPGVYLLRIDGGSRSTRSLIPLIVRSPSFSGRVALVMPDTTWQAYNSWGGYSLYHGPRNSFENRSRAVPFDRPYDWRTGASDFIPHELPFVVLAEKLGIPLGYASDVDLQRVPAAFRTARAIVSVGHDEYYSPAMRETLTTARDHGVNLAFFGGNDMYRKIRFAATSGGDLRLQINYKDATDPIKIPSQVTTQWREAPSNDPESSLTGADYRCASTIYYPMVVADPTSWLFAGARVTAGTKLPGVVGQEFDGINTDRPMPRPMTILFHSPVICTHRPTFQDSTYYTTSSGAGVLDIGAYFWNCAIARTCPARIDGPTSDLVTRVTTNFLLAAAAGPLGKTHPAVDNLRSFYPKAPVLR